jgi:uncharacterized protein YebE (UPF0316 family)
LIERRLAFGNTVLRVITPEKGHELADAIRDTGHPATCFEGTGAHGPVVEVCVACRRKRLPEILTVVNELVPDAFYVTEPAGTVRTIRRPTMQPPTGWRAVLKKK